MENTDIQQAVVLRLGTEVLSKTSSVLLQAVIPELLWLLL